MSVVISELRRYPLKSGAGESLAHASFGVTGIARDRSFMLVDAVDHCMLTQRNRGAERLALIRSSYDNEGVSFIAPGCSVLRISPPRSGMVIHTTVHSSPVRGLDCGEQAAAWFSAYLRKPFPNGVRLIGVDPTFWRELNPKWVGEQYQGTTRFADGYPILVTNEASLAELNRRIEQGDGAAISMDRFRPNLVLRGLAPFAEDTLGGLSFPAYPGVTLRFVKPCERCPMTTIDQVTGSRPSKEPLATLATFRRWGMVSDALPLGPESNQNVIFGVNAVVEGVGPDQEVTVSRDTEVTVLPRRTA